MLKFLSRGLSLSILTGAIVLTFAIIVFLMAVVLAGEGPVRGAIACQLGLAENCVRKELMEERQKLRNMQRQNREMNARNQELEALLERLASLDHAASSYVIFYKDETGPYAVSTGHTYASLLDPNTLTGAHCYFHAKVSGAGSRQIRLAEMSRRMRIKNERYSKRDLRDTGVSRGDIAALQARCKWPAGAR